MREFANARFAEAAPELSVLIPFLRDDPSPLLDRLLGEGENVEIILLDDGTASEPLTAALRELVQSASLPLKLLTLEQNIGRAKGRNLLADVSRADYLLFLDADMLPDSANFIGQWLDFVRSKKPAAAFGGLSLKQAPQDHRFAVHRAMAAKSDCPPAAQRRQQPEKHLFTSNLLIRRDVFRDHPFDSSFSGWGWEDVEWAMRVSNAHPISHPDIPATHAGLDTVPELMRKYRQSAANFARIAQLHPQFVTGYPSYKAALLFNRLKIAAVIRWISSAVAKLDAAPVGLRAFSLRFYRAALYADALAGRQK